MQSIFYSPPPPSVYTLLAMTDPPSVPPKTHVIPQNLYKYYEFVPCCIKLQKKRYPK